MNCPLKSLKSQIVRGEFLKWWAYLLVHSLLRNTRYIQTNALSTA